VGGGSVADFTAMGDTVNVTARLASEAAPGELLVTEEAWARGGLVDAATERRSLQLKGRTAAIDVRVLRLESS
jgi:adenylate cyclase